MTSNNKILLPEGNYNANVLITSVGNVGVQSTVSPIAIALVLDSATPNNGSANGGFPVSVIGSGFPDTLQELTVTLCGKSADLISVVDNSVINFYAPACAAGVSTLTVSSSTSSQDLPFTY